MNVSNGGQQAQRSTFRHSFNSSYNPPSQDDLTDGLDPIDCDFIFECLGHVNSDMTGQGLFPPMQTVSPTVNNHHGRTARSPTKKSTRISSTPKEKSSASPRATRPKSSAMTGSTMEDTQPVPCSIHDEDEPSMDECDNDQKLSLKDIKNNQLEASKDRRRERNKVLARKTRCKKKAEFEFLRKQLLKLQGENERLKDMVKGSLPSPFSAKVLLDHDVELPEHIANVVQDLIKTIEGSDPSLLFRSSRVGGREGFLRSFCVSNPSAPDCPIVYCSPGFSELTGYDMHAIVGHNCRFLQGPETDRDQVHKLQVAVTEGREEVVIVKNYRKDGTTFWNRIQMTPLRDAKSNQITFFVGIQYEVSGPNPLSMSGHAGSSTSLLALTALSADYMGVVMGRGTSPNNGSSANNDDNRFYHNSSYNNVSMGYSDVHSHNHTHLSPQLRGPNHHGHINGSGNGGLEGVSTNYGMMMGLVHQPFADDRSSLGAMSTSGSTTCGYSSQTSSACDGSSEGIGLFQTRFYPIHIYPHSQVVDVIPSFFLHFVSYDL